MPECISNSLEGQVVPLTGTDLHEAVREKVVEAIYAAQRKGKHLYAIADAAIAAHLEVLENIDQFGQAVSRDFIRTIAALRSPKIAQVSSDCATKNDIAQETVPPKTGGERHE